MTIQEFCTSVQTAIATAAGLPGSKVIWEGPNTERPHRPFIALTIVEDGDEELLPEEEYSDNPDPSPPIYPAVDLGALVPEFFNAGATLTCVSSPQAQFVIRAFPEVDPVPFLEITAPGGVPTLTVHCGDAGEVTGADVIQLLQNEATPDFVTVGTGNSSPITFGYSTAFSDGFPSQDPLLLKHIDRPEIVVRLVSFADSAKTGAVSPAFEMLKRVRRKMMTEATTDALDPITVLGRGNVTNATLVLETGYEGRAVLDLKFGSIETESEGINTIETVRTHIQIKDAEDSTIVEKTVDLSNE